jgi:hypothetical protein
MLAEMHWPPAAISGLPVTTRWLARHQARAGLDLPPKQHIRRAEPRRRWERLRPQLPEAPTYPRIWHQSTERDLPNGRYPGRQAYRS